MGLLAYRAFPFTHKIGLNYKREISCARLEQFPTQNAPNTSQHSHKWSATQPKTLQTRDNTLTNGALRNLKPSKHERKFAQITRLLLSLRWEYTSLPCLRQSRRRQTELARKYTNLPCLRQSRRRQTELALEAHCASNLSKLGELKKPKAILHALGLVNSRMKRDSNSRRSLPSHAFEACSLDRSDIHPLAICCTVSAHKRNFSIVNHAANIKPMVR